MGAMESEKTMFEVYRDAAYSGRYRVVYFTELQDHNKETEINRAAAGEHYFDGYIGNFGKDEAKSRIQALVDRLNAGEGIAPEDFRRELAGHLA